MALAAFRRGENALHLPIAVRPEYFLEQPRAFGHDKTRIGWATFPSCPPDALYKWILRAAQEHAGLDCLSGVD